MALQAAEVKPAKRKVTLVSVYPSYRLVLSVDLKELRHLENGRFREVEVQPMRALDFVNHYGTLECTESDMNMLRDRPDYWFKWMALEDLAKHRENAPQQYEGFVQECINRSAIAGITLRFNRSDLEKRLRECEREHRAA